MEVSAMGRNQLKSDDVQGFVTAFWDELKDAQEMYGVAVVLDIRLKVNRGGLSFHAMAIRSGEEGDARLAGTARVDWPSDKYTTLHACLYRLAMALDHAVQEDYHQRTGQWYSSPRT
jgi:hypothetical protein